MYVVSIICTQYMFGCTIIYQEYRYYNPYRVME